MRKVILSVFVLLFSLVMFSYAEDAIKFPLRFEKVSSWMGDSFIGHFKSVFAPDKIEEILTNSMEGRLYVDNMKDQNMLDRSIRFSTDKKYIVNEDINKVLAAAGADRAGFEFFMNRDSYIYFLVSDQLKVFVTKLAAAGLMDAADSIQGNNEYSKISSKKGEMVYFSIVKKDGKFVLGALKPFK